MKYRSDKNGVMISQLGYGCMRFTKNGNKIIIISNFKANIQRA